MSSLPVWSLWGNPKPFKIRPLPTTSSSILLDFDLEENRYHNNGTFSLPFSGDSSFHASGKMRGEIGTSYGSPANTYPVEMKADQGFIIHLGMNPGNDPSKAAEAVFEIDDGAGNYLRLTVSTVDVTLEYIGVLGLASYNQVFDTAMVEGDYVVSVEFADSEIQFSRNAAPQGSAVPVTNAPLTYTGDLRCSLENEDVGYDDTRVTTLEVISTFDIPDSITYLDQAILGPVCVTLPVITGTPTPGEEIQVSNGVWNGSIDHYEYKWYRHDGVDTLVSEDAAYTVTSDDTGYRLYVEVHAIHPSNSLLDRKVKVQTWVIPIAEGFPAVVTSPSIVGTPQVGEYLQALPGTWSNDPTFEYRWMINDSEYGVGEYFYVHQEHFDQNIRLDVDGSNEVGTVTASSNLVGPVTSTNKPNVISENPPVVYFPESGNFHVQYEASVFTGDWNNYSGLAEDITVEWIRGGRNGTVVATASTYTFQEADLGQAFWVRFTATNENGSGVYYFFLTDAVGEAPIPLYVGDATIQGENYVGETLTASTGNWDNNPTFSYAWFRDSTAGVQVAGDVDSYSPVLADVGSVIVLQITGTNDYGEDVITVSTLTILEEVVDPPVNLVLPVINGALEVGKYLIAGDGEWRNKVTSITKTWHRGSPEGPQIGTGWNYVPQPADVGETIYLKETATNIIGSTSVSSTGVGPIASTNLPYPISGDFPSIVGTFQEGETLTADVGSWGNSPTNYYYNWIRMTESGSMFVGTDPTYVLTVDDVGHTIVLTIDAYNGFGGNGADSQESPVIGAAPVAPVNQTLPTISGTVKVDDTLTANPGTWDGADSYAYEWYRGGQAGVMVHDEITYTLHEDDEGEVMAVKVTATNEVGSTVAWSNDTATVAAEDNPTPPVNTVEPFITGDPYVGETLTGNVGTWSNDPTFTYQWRRGGVLGTVVGTGLTYEPVNDDIGSTLVFLVEATNDDGVITVASDESPTIMASGILSDIFTNPVTTARTGSVTTYNVGPGQAYEDIDDVPWGDIVSGGVVVNIYYRATPYTWRFGICGRGTSNNWIDINGVTDASGNRPRFNFLGAPMAPSCQRSAQGGRNVFGADAAYGEDLGSIVIKPPASGAHHRPCYIRIANLELHGSVWHDDYVTTTGASRNDVHFGNAIYLLRAGDFISGPDSNREDHILIENVVGYDNGQSVFTQQANNDMEYTCHNVTLRNCRFYGNGVDGRPFEHNVYMQCTRPLVEYCYFGALRPASQGASYKSRSYREVFRYNYVETHARALDFVHPEDQDDGVVAQLGEGVDIICGNIIVNDWTMSGGGAMVPIHYGGDNSGEDDGNATPAIPQPPEYRQTLYFFNNTVINRNNNDLYRRLVMFDLSTTEQTVHAWNNIFVMMGGAGLRMSWVEFAGTVNLHGTNLLYAPDGIFDARENADVGEYAVNQLGTLIEADPVFMSTANGVNADWSINAGSPAINAGGGVPGSLADQAWLAAYAPVEFAPRRRTNGALARNNSGNVDLGACELDTSVPINSVAPSISGDDEVGSLLTASPGTWSNSPNFTYQWRREGVNISGATSSTYTTQAADGGQQLTVLVTATNPTTGRVNTAVSSGFAVAADPNAPSNTAIPVVTGQLFVGGTANGTNGTWTNSPTGYTYQWLKNGEVVGTFNSYTFQATDEGSTFVFRVVAENAFGSSGANSATTAAIGGEQPLEPIDGVFEFAQPNGTLIGALNDNLLSPGNGLTRYECVDGALQCTDGTGGFGERVYFANGQGADQASEGTVEAGFATDAEMQLSVEADGTRTGYWARFTTTQIHVYNAVGSYFNSYAHGVNTATTDLNGRVEKSGGTVRYFANGVEIATMPTNQGGTALTGGYPGFGLQVGADETDIRMLDWTDDMTVPTEPVNTVDPTISGDTIGTGDVLTGTQGTWTNADSYAYQWQRNNVDIPGETNLTYTTVTEDLEQDIRFEVTATNTSTSESTVAYSDPVTIETPGAAPTNTAVPTISGTLEVGQTLTANPGTWTGSPSSYAYSWLRGGSGGVEVGTASTYVLQAADEGEVMAVEVEATNANGTSAPAISANTAAVQPAPTTGLFNFSEANGTTIGSVDAGFASPGSGLSRFVVQNGYLQPLDGTGGFGERFYYTTGQGDDQAIEVLIPAGMDTDTEVLIMLQANAARQGYYIRYTFSQIHIYNASGYLTSQAHGKNMASVSAVVKMTLIGNEWRIYLDGNNGGPINVATGRLTGGYPGISIVTGADETDGRIDYLDVRAP